MHTFIVYIYKRVSVSERNHFTVPHAKPKNFGKTMQSRLTNTTNKFDTHFVVES